MTRTKNPVSNAIIARRRLSQNNWKCYYNFCFVLFVCLFVSRRLDNNMNIYKGVVQRAQLQLARFQVSLVIIFNVYVMMFSFAVQYTELMLL